MDCRSFLCLPALLYVVAGGCFSPEDKHAASATDETGTIGGDSTAADESQIRRTTATTG